MHYDVDQYAPTLHITSEEYETDNVTVSVKWAQQVGVTYCARVTPSAPLISTGSTNRQLVLEYNMEYNFTVVAIAPCRPNVTTIWLISYGEVLCMYYTKLYTHSITHCLSIFV